MPKATGGPICSTTEVIFTPSWFYKELQCWKHMLFRDWSIAVQSSENSYFPEAIYNPFLASDLFSLSAYAKNIYRFQTITCKSVNDNVESFICN